jgi:hypothetical protein
MGIARFMRPGGLPGLGSDAGTTAALAALRSLHVQ